MAEEIWIFEREPIRVSFNTKGYSFYKGGRGLLGTPVEAHLRLIAVKGKDKVEISSVSNLKGRVAIKTPDEALEFIRLFTSIETHYLFADIDYIEPHVAEGVTDPGEYTREYKKRMNLEPAGSSLEGNSFVIERNIIDQEGKLYRATERVGRDGAYSIAGTKIIDGKSPIIYPIYQ